MSISHERIKALVAAFDALRETYEAHCEALRAATASLNHGSISAKEFLLRMDVLAAPGYASVDLRTVEHERAAFSGISATRLRSEAARKARRREEASRGLPRGSLTLSASRSDYRLAEEAATRDRYAIDSEKVAAQGLERFRAAASRPDEDPDSVWKIEDDALQELK